MTEKLIVLEGVDPAEFYGLYDVNLEKIKTKFPKLKVIARGSTLKIMGEESEINRFDRKLTELIEYYTRYGHISPQVIDLIYDGGLPDVAPSNSDNQQIIVYGNNGLIVRARTVNQIRLLEAYAKNDLIFVNHVMRITRAEIDEKLDELARMIADKVPEPQLKQRLLEMIHDHEKQAENA